MLFRSQWLGSIPTGPVVCLAHVTCVLGLGPGEDGHKCFHSSYIHDHKLAFQTLIWDLGLFISVQSIGFELLSLR